MTMLRGFALSIVVLACQLPSGLANGTPTIQIPTGAGAMGTNPTGTIRGTDAAGFIHTVVGASPAATGDIAVVKFSKPYPEVPLVIITGGSSGGLNAKAYAKDVTNGGFTITTTAGYGGSGARLDYYYQVIR